MLCRDEIQKALAQWNQSWDGHDLEGVMELFHKDIIFENWTGARVRGKEALQRAWEPWFQKHGGFRFIGKDIFIDEGQQKVLYQWTLEWPSNAKGYLGKPERRDGVDVMHFKDGKIIRKSSYSKSTLEIEGKKVNLVAQ